MPEHIPHGTVAGSSRRNLTQEVRRRGPVTDGANRTHCHRQLNTPWVSGGAGFGHGGRGVIRQGLRGDGLRRRGCGQPVLPVMQQAASAPVATETMTSSEQNQGARGARVTPCDFQTSAPAGRPGLSFIYRRCGIRTRVGARLSGSLRAWLFLAIGVAVLVTPTRAFAQIFDADADYRIFTSYAARTRVELSGFLRDGVNDATFTLGSCDATRSDYYDSVSLAGGTLTLVPNRAGHVHGGATQDDTVCTVTGAAAGDSEDREFRFFITADRQPGALRSSHLQVTAVALSVAAHGPDRGVLADQVLCGWAGERTGGTFAVILPGSFWGLAGRV